ncbi:23S rRNA (adenine(2503)-C(2))-methyltransferase RlmN [Candidatus Aerophobetes bacterium]|uniref:Probable dual-specificity RNA methyltransferase RlmN n=1 Tax=Aerophobetes bacterium TaxID=2030807 RepID=A0A2A4X5N4_UNCAE|nr:MAG: 23S rRNA (adenine(2503)-C(2))-methyltransferase RlmN [Candidatus Aerophobetes bacterium]
MSIPHQLSSKDWTQWFANEGESSFTSKQFMQWMYDKLVLDFSQMSNLKKSVRAKLQQTFEGPSLELVKTSVSKDEETIKFLWKLQDEQLVESVLIKADGRNTVCVSSQVGCKARCAFCASGRRGLIRNLSVAEVVEQVIMIGAYLKPQEERVSHLVFMGMGEPFHNTDTIITVLKTLMDSDKLNFSNRKITVSTVGVIEGIEQLMREDLRVNLALSLHAPNQRIRKKIIPTARQADIADILKAVFNYGKMTKRDVTLEYILLSDVNDQLHHADELADLVRKEQCTVNVIPYNPVQGVNLKRPETAQIKAFVRVLKRRRVNVTIRYTKGTDIDAACGQLAFMEKKSFPIEVKAV